MAEKKTTSKAASKATKKRQPAKAESKRKSTRSEAPTKPAKSKSSVAKQSRPASSNAAAKSSRASLNSSKNDRARATPKPSAKKAGAAASAPQPTSAAKADKVKPKAATRSDGRPGASPSTKPARPAEVERPMPKTHLTDKQLQMFKEMLLEKRRELLGDVRTLTKDALGRSRQDSSGDLSSMPIHMADLGTDNWEQDFTLGLIANEQQLVREIDEALRRIEERTYGICLATHKPIGIARLKAKPWAKYCIEYARQRELGRF